MRKLIIIFLLLLNYRETEAQVNERVDSLTREICMSFQREAQPLDSVSIMEVFQLHLTKYFEKMDATQVEQAFDKINIRLQTTCNPYKQYMKRYDTRDWISVDSCPSPIAGNADLKDFFLIKDFYYIEPTGDTTRVQITENSWTDFLAGNTYSKLSLKRLSPHEFAITFKESNNKIKQNMSKVGDKYYYTIISRDRDAYLLCARVLSLKGATLFKLYPGTKAKN